MNDVRDAAKRGARMSNELTISTDYKTKARRKSIYEEGRKAGRRRTAWSAVSIGMSPVSSCFPAFLISFHTHPLASGSQPPTCTIARGNG
jgi:hypothetical protein